MKEHPIIFNGEMVRAILEGHKVMTRRVIHRVRGIGKVTEFGSSDSPGYQWIMRGKYGMWNDLKHEELIARCPYGRIGDTLWVRETWRRHPRGEGYIQYRADETVRVKASHGGMYPVPQFGGYDLAGIRWRSSRHMFRWASRIMLEIVNVGVGLVQDISEEDVLAEGCELSSWGLDQQTGAELGPRTAGFAELWDSINAKRGFGWGVNPFVWLIEFKVKEERS